MIRKKYAFRCAAEYYFLFNMVVSYEIGIQKIINRKFYEVSLQPYDKRDSGFGR